MDKTEKIRGKQNKVQIIDNHNPLVVFVSVFTEYRAKCGIVSSINIQQLASLRRL